MQSQSRVAVCCHENFCRDLCTGIFRTVYNDGSWHNDVVGTFNPSTYVSFGEDMAGELYVVSQVDGKIFSVEDTSTAFLRDAGSSMKTSALSVFPNPGHGNLMINYFTSQQEEVQIRVYDITGKLITAFRENAIMGMNRFPISSPLNSGNYVVVVQSAIKINQQKFIVE